jgi:hypothetical protein
LNSTRFIYTITMMRSKSVLTKKYGKSFWNDFSQISKRELNEILPQVTDIGESLFSLNYSFGPAYIAWFKAFSEQGLNVDEIGKNIWLMNERMITIIPQPILKQIGKSNLQACRKKAKNHVEKQNIGKIHPYDWKVNYRDINTNTFEIDITECALKRMADDFGASDLLPSICRMDYMFSHLMGNGFERTMTLGDGNDLCNCRYHIVGKCEWSPEKGFVNRK